jgi:hypothetical protein
VLPPRSKSLSRPAQKIVKWFKGTEFAASLCRPRSLKKGFDFVVALVQEVIQFGIAD